jgi:hypothetical protein
LAASSKLERVRVEGSKNSVTTTFPCKVGTLGNRRVNTSWKLALVCKTIWYSSGVKSAKPKTCCRCQTIGDPSNAQAGKDLVQMG